MMNVRNIMSKLAIEGTIDGLGLEGVWRRLAMRDVQREAEALVNEQRHNVDISEYGWEGIGYGYLQAK